MNNIQRNYFPALDIMKFIMALLIMFAHISSENVSISPLLKMLFSLYNFGVPFFFACSGYLFFLKLKYLPKIHYIDEYIKFSKRIGIMYLVWSCIYFFFVLNNWYVDGFQWDVIVRYVHKSLVFSTYGTIWFLPALWVGISVIFFFFRWGVKPRIIIIIGVFVYFVGSLGYSYTRLLHGGVFEVVYLFYDSIFFTTRNGLFAAFPMVLIGAYIALTKNQREGHYINFIFMVIFSLLFVIEAFYIKIFQMGDNVDMGIMLLPSVYFMIKWLISVDLKENSIYIWMRKMSMLVFLGQRLFITAIPSILPVIIVTGISKNGYIGLVIYSSSVLLFSFSIIKLSRKYKWLKILW